ncbi:aldehyde dehydrogenase family protein [Pseudaestuariivita sp.]|uniref:aldehyde dehydrogenase family protein n=1 Tax=Pseudaestuariivita sp. TaxID=2211669 RepID=UPI00405A0421
MKPLLIGGQWIETAQAVPNVNPSDTKDIIDHYAQGGRAEAQAAVRAAADAAPGWAHSTPQERHDLLARVAADLMARAEEIGTLLSREEGKIRAEGIAEATRAARIFDFFAGEALRAGGELLPSVRPDIEVAITHEPVGPVALITPWNFPIAIPAWKTAPALAFGNPVILKPAELVPGCAWVLAEVLQNAGCPPGVFNLVMGEGSVVGAALLAAPEVKAVSFTGSVPTGQRIAAASVPMNRKVQLEMGGKNPLVVLDDADLERATDVALDGAFFSTGQRCTASSRIIVTEGIHGRFVELLAEKVRGLKVGPALDPASQIGPVVDRTQLDQDLRYIDIARREGGNLRAGGNMVRCATPGYFLAPTLISDTDPAMTINREEVFGPVASVIRVRDYEEALHVANDTPFGLSAGICTTSLKHAQHFRRHAQAGMVFVNLPTAGVDYHVPFGGTKGSSFGPREQGAHARAFYTQVKTSYVFGG